MAPGWQTDKVHNSLATTTLIIGLSQSSAFSNVTSAEDVGGREKESSESQECHGGKGRPRREKETSPRSWVSPTIVQAALLAGLLLSRLHFSEHLSACGAVK